MTLKLDEMILLNYIMGGVSILQPATRGLLKYFFVWWLCLYFFWHTLNAVCWDFSSCIPFLFELCEMDIQVNLALNIKWQIYGSLEKMLQTSRMRWAHLDLMERNKRAALRGFLFFFQHVWKIFLILMNTLISKSIFSFLNIPMNLFEVGPQGRLCSSVTQEAEWLSSPTSSQN